MSSDGGKGSSRRPSSVSDQELADNWSRIFKKRYEALEAMVAENEKLGLYEDYDKITRYNTETQEVKK